MKVFLLCVSLLTGLSPWALAQAKDWASEPPSFGTAKNRLYQVYTSHHLLRTFYCGCAFDGATHQVDLNTCPAVKDKKRGGQVEWEHIVPASRIRRFPWTPASFAPSCQGEVDPEGCAEHRAQGKPAAVSNPYNLVPSSGAVNAARSNRRMVEFEQTTGGRALCTLHFGANGGEVEPGDQRKGPVARAYLYMDQSVFWGELLGEGERALYQRWSDAHRVTEAECLRAEVIREHTGVVNLLVEGLCRPKGKVSSAH